MTNHDLTAHARALLEVNRYLTLATADSEGRPWTCTVYFAAAQRWEFYWVSAADAQHSRNLTGRPQVSLVVFDSTVEPCHGRAVYAVGEARELSSDELNRGLEMYPGPSHRGAAAPHAPRRTPAWRAGRACTACSAHALLPGRMHGIPGHSWLSCGVIARGPG